MSFGSAIGAIVSLKNNKRQSRGRFEKHINSSETITGVKSHRQPSAEELLIIKERLIAQQKARRRKIIITTSAVFGFILCALLYFLLWF